MTYACIKCAAKLDDHMGRETWAKTRVGAFCPGHFWAWQQRQERRQQERKQARLDRLNRIYPGIDIKMREGR